MMFSKTQTPCETESKGLQKLTLQVILCMETFPDSEVCLSLASGLLQGGPSRVYCFSFFPFFSLFFFSLSFFLIFFLWVYNPGLEGFSENSQFNTIRRLCIKQTASGELLYSTWSSARCSVMTWRVRGEGRRRRSKTEGICVYLELIHSRN